MDDAFLYKRHEWRGGFEPRSDQNGIAHYCQQASIGANGTVQIHLPRITTNCNVQRFGWVVSFRRRGRPTC